MTERLSEKELEEFKEFEYRGYAIPCSLMQVHRFASDRKLIADLIERCVPGYRLWQSDEIRTNILPLDLHVQSIERNRAVYAQDKRESVCFFAPGADPMDHYDMLFEIPSQNEDDKRPVLVNIEFRNGFENLAIPIAGAFAYAIELAELKAGDRTGIHAPYSIIQTIWVLPSELEDCKDSIHSADFSGAEQIEDHDRTAHLRFSHVFAHARNASRLCRRLRTEGFDQFDLYEYSDKCSTDKECPSDGASEKPHRGTKGNDA